MSCCVPTMNLPNNIVGSVEEIKDSNPIIVTHDGRFHCDDALAVGMILQLPEYKNAHVIRSRNSKDWEKGAIVVDVGGVYDPERKRFDHHQRGFSLGFFDDDSLNITKMSSAGMIFKILTEGFNIPQDHIDILHEKVYKKLIESIDAIDNGVDISDTPTKYIVRSDISSRVGRLNEEWNEYVGDNITADRFRNAIKITLEELSDLVTHMVKSWIPVREIFNKGYQNRFQTHPSGRVIELSIGCPFEEHLHMAEEEIEDKTSNIETDKINDVLFAFFPNTNDGTSWRVRAIKKNLNSFENRLSLPERYRGLRKDELLSFGLDGITFIHHAGFLAGANTRDACLNLINITLKEENIYN